jgi:hypothetical protein
VSGLIAVRVEQPKRDQSCGCAGNTVKSHAAREKPEQLEVLEGAGEAAD